MNFITLSSLPRSGSTLLMYILNQNPKFTIGPDSEISYILNTNKNYIKDHIRTYQIPHETATECFLNFCRSGTQSWIDTLVDSENIFIDKSRGWIIDMDFTFKVFPKLKMIINIRDLRAIVNSFEKINSESIYADTRAFYKDLDTDLQRQRLDAILNFQILKESLTSLRELTEIPKKYNSNILVTRYEDLIEDPDYFMQTLYDFLELPYFQHNFENIEQDNNYYDNAYMPYGNHKIRNSLEKTINQKFEYIRPDLLEQMTKGYSWYFKNFYSDRLDNK